MRDLLEIQAQADEAAAAEFYETPARAIDELMLSGPALPGGVWLDPCAGRGAIPRAVSRHRPDVTWYLCELRAECRTELEQLRPAGLVIEDALAPMPSPERFAWPAPTVVIMNSPFSLTVRFVESAWKTCPGAWVASLQRQSFIGPARASWLSRHMPDRYQLSYRPSFRRDGRTDGCEYEWNIWPPDGRDRSSGRCGMLLLPVQGELFATGARP